MGTVDAGWTFTGWSISGCEGTGPCTVTITGDTTVTANFTQNEYALTITQVTGGLITATPDASIPPERSGDPNGRSGRWLELRCLDGRLHRARQPVYTDHEHC